ncbi:MAG: efflux RND transporter periplasmic adaptor subunit [Mariprofundaceae bacterium]|nr:efflux RND transporter periplasmic adaptor subunit [Mariprofundaceae bacterium]
MNPDNHTRPEHQCSGNMPASILPGLFIVTTLLLAACSPEQEAVVQEFPDINVPLLTVQQEAVNEHTISSGTVISDRRISIASRLSGYIHNIAVREGDQVKQGDALFRVDPVDVMQVVHQTRADLRDATTDLERYRSLLKDQAVSRQQFEKVRLRHTLAKSKLTQAENQLQYAEVKAPVDGTVVKKLLNAGDLASPGSSVLVLENPRQISVETHISERFISAIHEGDAATVVLASLTEPLQAGIRQIVPAADPLTHQFLVKLSLPLRSEVRPGMFAEVRFAVGTRQALLLPAHAIVNRHGLHGVYVADADNRLHYRLVRLGQTMGKRIEVLSGLHDGERIAATISPDMRSGMRASGN